MIAVFICVYIFGRIRASGSIQSLPRTALNLEIADSPLPEFRNVFDTVDAFLIILLNVI